MRDPDAIVRVDGDSVSRRFKLRPWPDSFLHSSLAKEWIEEGRLTQFEWENENEIISEKIPFISYPHEWCDTQLFDAASFTLQLQCEAVANGFDLKDASAWNIIHRGTEPIFCDLSSFQNLSERIWWAGGQFNRQFLVPLLLAKKGKLQTNFCFFIWRDGVPESNARKLLGTGRFLTRYWPLVAEAKRPIRIDNEHILLTNSQKAESIASYRDGLHASLGWMLDGLSPKLGRANSHWFEYTENRDHYTSAALEIKRLTVAEWLRRIIPKWVADFGANTGEFSYLAAENGSQVISIDSDHDAVRSIYVNRPHAFARQIHPVLSVLDDLNSGRGWEGTEYKGLYERLSHRVDLVMMLALIHHLAVASSIPLSEIASFAAKCTRSFLIVELIDPIDTQFKLLLQQYRRDPNDFKLAAQRSAFLNAGFLIEAEVNLVSVQRTLLLLRKS